MIEIYGIMNSTILIKGKLLFTVTPNTATRIPK